VQHALTDPYLDEIVAVLKSYDPERIILYRGLLPQLTGRRESLNGSPVCLWRPLTS